MSKRTMKQGWVFHGFDVLRIEGHVGLKVDRMVKILGVSRGIFYWHFADIQTFHAELIVARRERINKDVIAQLQLMADAEITNPAACAADFARILTKPNRLANKWRLAPCLVPSH